MRLWLILWTWALVLTLAPPCHLTPETESEKGVTESDLILATEYLQHYYDLQEKPVGRRKRSDSALASKVRDMQSFFGLNVSGHLDSETLQVMRAPRCGVSDVHEYVSHQGAKWSKNTLSYRIRKYTSDLPPSTVDSEIASALNVWSKASPLKFVKSSSNTADIMVDFATRSHGDSYPFDGPRGTLAHAFGPGDGIGGDTHFDDAEKWTTGSEGFNLFLVAAHEFGHALGLKHSRNPASLMYPTYKKRDPKNVLSREDTSRISSLYSQRAPAPAWRPQSPWASLFNSWFLGQRFAYRLRDKCNPNVAFDAVTSLEDTVLLFRGRPPVRGIGRFERAPPRGQRYVWMKQNQQDNIKKVPIRKLLPKARSGINAAYTIPQRSSLYLFTGSKLWTVEGSQVKRHPEPIQRFGLPKWLKKIDAVLHTNTTGRTLIFAQDLYWSFNENRKRMEDSYPRKTTEDFPGIKTPVDAAMYRDGAIYFFHGPEVYKYDQTGMCIAGVNKGNSWLGCRTEKPKKELRGRQPMINNLCQNEQKH